MKKLLASFCLFAFALTAHAQIVNIPDSFFKTYLVQYEPVIDTNNDGEIQLTEAQAVTSLTINGLSTTIENLTGIEAFTNLTSLTVEYQWNIDFDPRVFTHLETLTIRSFGVLELDLTGLNDLREVRVNDGPLISINVTGLTNLTLLDCRGTALTSLDLTGLTGLLDVDCSANYGLSSLTTTGANNIRRLSCNWCALTSLEVSHMAQLNYLDCGYQRYEGDGIANLDLTGLTALTHLDCNGNNLASLNVAHLVNLTHLDCQQNHLTSLNVAPLVNLTFLKCTGNELPILNVAPLTQLTVLDCSDNLLSGLNVDTLPNLTYLGFRNNTISTINLSNNPLLTDLFCEGNQLSALPISNLTQLEYLKADDNQLTTIDLMNLHALKEIRLTGNLFTTLDFSQNPAVIGYGIFIRNSPNLISINAKNGVQYEMGTIYGFDITNCPNLESICVNENDIAYMTQEITAGNFGTTPIGVVVNSYCNFVPGGVNNTITGTVTLDTNFNGCDAGDIHPPNFNISINDGATSGATFSSPAGNYLFYTQSGNYTLTPQFNNPYYTITPTTSTVNFAVVDGSTQTRNFCVLPNGVHNDLEITLLRLGEAVPGFDARYVLTYKNKGTQIMNGGVTFTFDDAIFDFVSAEPAISNQTVNNVSWSYANLLPFESRMILVTLNLNSPVETPAVNLGDIINTTAMVSPVLTDETSGDNIFHLTQTAMASVDPNDKTCIEGNAITPEMVGGYLNYVIRFQNSGNYFATNVVVKDIIDTSKFDINSLDLVASSHPHTTRVTGNKVEFIFENIMLPAEMHDEPGSHGFVAFRIKTKNNLVLGNEIRNTADIYFDFNAPIITNTTSTTVALLSLDETEANGISMSPIPVKDILQVKALDTISAVEIFDIQSRLLQVKTADAPSITVDFTGRPAGIYLVKVHTANGIKTQKVIKD